MRSARGTVLATAAVTALLMGCASASTESPFRRGARSARESGSIQVVAESHAFLDMHVYVLQGGQSRSLGMLTGLSRATWTIPQVFVDSAREIPLMADPIGSNRAFVSPSLLAYPGERIRLNVENNLRLSSAWVEAVYEEPPSDEGPPDGSDQDGSDPDGSDPN